MYALFRTTLSLAVLAALLVVSVPACAASPLADNHMVEEVLVTGTRLGSVVAAMPGHVTVINREEIERRQRRSVLDLLRSVPGLHVTQYGGRGGISSVFVRGAEPNFTVVLVDGVKVNDPNNTRGGSFDFSTFNLAEVERIEIVRGAQSSVYGSDGLAAIINVITRRPGADPALALDAEVGPDGFHRAAFHASGPIAKTVGAALTVSTADDGDDIAGNSFETHNLSLNVRAQVSHISEFNVSARYGDTRSRAYPEDSGGPNLAVLSELDGRDQAQKSLAARYAHTFSDSLVLNLRATRAEHDETTRSPGIAPGVRQGVPPNRSTSGLERTVVGAHIVFDLSTVTAATFGVDREDEQGRLQGSLEVAPGFELPTDFSLRRRNTGLFGEITVAPAAGWGLTASLRRDNPSEAGSQSSGRVGVQYQFEGLRLFGAWSEGFKLPSFFALGHGLVGNPDLVPETSRNLELGLTGSRDKRGLRWSLTGFRSEYEDLIDFDFDLFTNVNRRHVDISGVEAAARVRASPRFEIGLHVTKLDINVDSGTTLRQRPDWRGGVNVYWAVTPALNVTADWLHVGSSFDSYVPTGSLNLDGYQRLDVEVAWQRDHRLRVWVGIDNVLDDNYQETIGFPALGTRIRAGLRYQL